MVYEGMSPHHHLVRMTAALGAAEDWAGARHHSVGMATSEDTEGMEPAGPRHHSVGMATPGGMLEARHHSVGIVAPSVVGSVGVEIGRMERIASLILPGGAS
jgi:hypothetical protein